MRRFSNSNVIFTINTTFFLINQHILQEIFAYFGIFLDPSCPSDSSASGSVNLVFSSQLSVMRFGVNA